MASNRNGSPEQLAHVAAFQNIQSKEQLLPLREMNYPSDSRNSDDLSALAMFRSKYPLERD